MLLVVKLFELCNKCSGQKLLYKCSQWFFSLKVGPFLQRLHSERYMRPLFDMAVHFYKMLAKVDKEVTHLRHMDAICDILYHVKYQFTGDSIKVDAERFVKELRPALQLRLRFISPGKYTLKSFKTNLAWNM